MAEHGYQQFDDNDEDPDDITYMSTKPSTRKRPQDDVPRVFVSDEEVRALEDEHKVMSESLEDKGKRMLAEALPKAILMVMKLAENGASDTIRMKAAQYIIDRNLGPVSASGPEISKAPWEKILEDVTITVPATNKQ